MTKAHQKRVCLLLYTGGSRIFPEEGANPQAGVPGYEFIKFPPKTAWNREKSGRWEGGGGCVPGCSLDSGLCYIFVSESLFKFQS